MPTISASIGKDHYRTTVTSRTNTLISDEPTDLGGADEGMAPHQLMAASLGACTCITLRMYADRKGWPLTSVLTHIDHERDMASKRATFIRTIELHGDLSAEQRERLLDIANRCPVHEILTGSIKVATELAF